MIPVNDYVLYRTIGECVKERRLALGVKQDELARMTGVTRTTITNLEAGNQRVTLALLYQLCVLLSITLTDLLPPIEAVVTLPDAQKMRLDQYQDLERKIDALIAERNRLLNGDVT